MIIENFKNSITNFKNSIINIINVNKNLVIYLITIIIILILRFLNNYKISPKTNEIKYIVVEEEEFKEENIN